MIKSFCLNSYLITDKAESWKLKAEQIQADKNVVQPTKKVLLFIQFQFLLQED